MSIPLDYPDTPRVFLHENTRKNFTVNLPCGILKYDKRSSHGVKTLAWSSDRGSQYAILPYEHQINEFLKFSQETLQVCPWSRPMFGISRETLNTSMGCSNLTVG